MTVVHICPRFTRRRLKLTPSKLARLAGVAAEAVRRYERNVPVPRGVKVKILRALYAEIQRRRGL